MAAVKDATIVAVLSEMESVFTVKQDKNRNRRLFSMDNVVLFTPGWRVRVLLTTAVASS